jgi:hypothetical protein
MRFIAGSSKHVQVTQHVQQPDRAEPTVLARSPRLSRLSRRMRAMMWRIGMDHSLRFRFTDLPAVPSPAGALRICSRRVQGRSPGWESERHVAS